MDPEHIQQLQDMDARLSRMESFIFKGQLPDRTIFDKKIIALRGIELHPQASAVTDLATPSGTYQYSEANASKVAVNAILAALRAVGIIKT